MSNTNLYSILGVKPTSSEEEIQKAYKILVMKYHPDLNHGIKNDEKIKQINFARDILTNSEKRRLYDLYGIDSTSPHFSELIKEQSFKQTRKKAKTKESFDLSKLNVVINLSVPLEQVIYGGEVEVDCVFDVIQIEIPKGVKNGSIMTIRGAGLQSLKDSRSSDLQIIVTHEANPYFWIVDNDIHCNLPLTIHEAFYGGLIQVPTGDGMITLKIKPNTENASLLKVQGKGISTKNSTGNMYFHVNVQTPPRTTSITAWMDEVSSSEFGNPRENLKF